MTGLLPSFMFALLVLSLMSNSCSRAQSLGSLFGSSNNDTATLQDWLWNYSFISSYKSPNIFSGLDTDLAAPIRELFPFPDTASRNFSAIDTVDFALLSPYISSLGGAAGPGLALAVISLVVGIVYLPIRLCVAFCNRKKQPKPPKPNRGVFTIIIFFFTVVCGTLAIVGCCLGIAANIKFTTTVKSTWKSVDSSIDIVLGMGDRTAGIVNTLQSDISGLFSDVKGEVRGAVNRMQGRTVSLLGSFTAVGDEIVALDTKLQAITPASQQPQPVTTAIHQMASQVAETMEPIQSLSAELNATNGTFSEILNKDFDLNFNVSDINTTINDALDKADTYVDFGRKYVNMAIGYDAFRLAAFNVLFALPIVSIIVVALAAGLRQGWLFHATVIIGFFVIFLAFLLGSIHLVLAIVLGEACHTVDTVQVPKTAVDVLNDCSIVGRDSLLTVAGVNITDMVGSFNVTQMFEQFSNSTILGSLNTSSVDEFLEQVIMVAQNDTTGNATVVGQAAVVSQQNNGQFANDIGNLFQATIDSIKHLITQFIDDLVAEIEDIAKCGFVPEMFFKVHQQVCVELQSSFDVMWLGSFIVAIFTIPAIVLESFLIKRFKRYSAERAKKLQGDAGVPLTETNPLARPTSRNVVAPEPPTDYVFSGPPPV